MTYESGGTIVGDAEFSNGDVYRVAIIDAAGTILVDASAAVTYTTIPDSGYTCHELMLDLE